ncbi:hypothetical protein CBW46_011910 [Paenibacillus xerothermodurans]|uniref:Cell envelope-related transcriptional attenuator domain-containing protein n=1 Tax=Paenibacillus xerothermodurans TaxID=1977292 RepID=A0A2W1N8D9_PAEXE|nr:hypothetical protein CBW46_011910 [Paenibacillus xerothermodurans]
MAKKIKWTLLSLAVLLVLGIGYYTYAFVQFSNSIQSKPEGSKLFGTLTSKSGTSGDNFVPPKWEGKQRVNILLLGGDSRGLKPNEVPRSDSLILASIDPVTKKAYLFSILRDTYVKIPGSGEDRINTALATGGPNLAMKTVSDLLGIPVQYYVYTDFKGFIALVDAVGGIDIEVEKDMKYSDAADGHEYDINLKKGMQHLDGKMALQYVRFRHDALSDFSRTERQRKFLGALAQKMQSTSSIIKLPRILSSIDPYIETNLSTTDMLKLGSLGYEAKTEGMVSEQIPPAELLIEKRVGGAAVLTVDRKKLQAYIRELFGGDQALDGELQDDEQPFVKSNTGSGVSSSSGAKNGSTSTSNTSGSKSSGTSYNAAPSAQTSPARTGGSGGTAAKPTANASGSTSSSNKTSTGETKSTDSNRTTDSTGKSSGTTTKPPADSTSVGGSRPAGSIDRSSGATAPTSTGTKSTNGSPTTGSADRISGTSQVPAPDTKSTTNNRSTSSADSSGTSPGTSTGANSTVKSSTSGPTSRSGGTSAGSSNDTTSTGASGSTIRSSATTTSNSSDRSSSTTDRVNGAAALPSLNDSGSTRSPGATREGS